MLQVNLTTTGQQLKGDYILTRKKIEGYPRILESIRYLQIELEEIKTTDAGIGHSVILDYRSGYPVPQTVHGFDQKLYDRKRKELENRLKEEREIREYIEGIIDPKTRTVFKLRYFKRLTWQQIANEIGEFDECYPRRYIHNKFLSENTKDTQNTKDTENTEVTVL